MSATRLIGSAPTPDSRYPIGPLTLILATMLLPVLAGATATVLDAAYVTRNAAGQLAWTSEGAAASRILAGGILALGVTGAVVLIRRPLRSLVFTMPVVALGCCAAWIAIAEVARPTNWSFVASHLAAMAVLVAVSLRLPSSAELQRLAASIVWIAFAALLFAAVVGDLGGNPCRNDKCSPIGVLVRSFFAHENAMGVYFAIGVPLVALAGGRWYRSAGTALLAVAVLITGGRGAYAALGVALLCVVFTVAPVRIGRVFQRSMRFTPLLALAASTFLFLRPSDRLFLTGRGLIFNLLRSHVEAAPWLGPGRGVLLHAFQTGASDNYLVAHEHGAAAYLLVNGGVIALVLFAIALAGLAVGPSTRYTALRLSIMNTVAATFLTEPIWELSARSPFFWSLLLVAAMHASAAHRVAGPQFSLHRARRRQPARHLGRERT